MASITISVPDTLVPRVVRALRLYYPNIDQGLTDGAFAKVAIIDHLRTVTRTVESQDAVDTALSAIDQTRLDAEAATDADTAAIQ